MSKSNLKGVSSRTISTHASRNKEIDVDCINFRKSKYNRRLTAIKLLSIQLGISMSEAELKYVKLSQD